MKSPPGQDLNWTSITDFRPGIHTAGAYTNAVGVKAPKGAADSSGTFACYALPSGALAPLPGRVSSYNLPIPDASNVTNGGQFFITALLALGNEATTGGPIGDELYVGLQYHFNNGGGQPFQPRGRLYRLRVYALLSIALGQSPTADLLFSQNHTNNDPSQLIAGQSFTVSRANTSNNLLPGNPYAAFGYNLGAAGEPKILVTPDPANPATIGVISFPLNSTVLGHQGRLVSMAFSNYTHYETILITNEQISFTDPPNSMPATFPSQQQVFVAEWPVGYGAWGSQSIGELFLVKQKGGGVYVTGDLANPTITRLPAVVSTAGAAGEAAATPIGLMYCTASDGVQLWNGGNATTKISRQLNDDFWVNPVFTTGDFGVNFRLETWDDWVLCSNNWLYDTVSQAWWKFENPAVAVYQWYAKSALTLSGLLGTSIMYCAPASYTALANTAVFGYEKGSPANTYQWLSLPIPVTVDRMAVISEVVLLVQGSGTVTVTLTGAPTAQTEGNTVTFSVASNTQPVRVRSTIFAIGYNVIVGITSTGTGSGPAPVVHEVHLGTTEGGKAGPGA